MELSRIKVLPQIASEHECTACLACENICPHNAINHYLADDGHVYVSINPKTCVGCLKCQRVCEKSRAYCGINNISESKIYAAWTKNDEDRAKATSGGIFAAIARTILESGGCVIGAKLNGFESKHSVIYSVDEIHYLQGSKYMASSMEDVYKVISEELPHRDVFFTGLGCQCAGVLAYFEGFKTEYRLYTADLVCGGIPSRILIEKFREQYQYVKGLASFRSKDRYELRVITDEGEKVIKEKTLPLHGFNCGLTNRYCCYNCQFAKAHRKTDITIGDLWDFSQFPSEHKLGISMIIIHSEEGNKLVDKSNIVNKPIEWKNTLLHNRRTVCGKQKIYLPRIHLVRNSVKMQPTAFLDLYGINMSPKQPMLFIFRVYRYLNQKILVRKDKKQINNICFSDKTNREFSGRFDNA